MGFCDYGGQDFGGFLGAGIGFIFMLLFWILVIWGIYTLIRIVAEKGSFSNLKDFKKEDEAVQIVKERYAKDEITREEFEQKMRDLRNDKNENKSKNT